MSKIDELIKEFCPNGVKFLQLGDVAQILNGYSFKSGKYSESGIRVVRISDVQKGKMSDKDLKFYPLEYEAEISRYLLRENDLVMSLTGNVGRVAMLSKTDLPAGLNQRVACIRPSEIVLTRWLFHFLDTDTFESDAMKNSTGGGQKNMSTVWLSKYKIPVPPLEVQKEIVNILDKFTQLEAELSAELEARRKQYAIYRHNLMLFGDDTEAVKLGELIDFINAKPHEKLVDPEGDIALMTSKFVSTQGKSARRIRSENVLTPAFTDDIAMVMSDLPNGRALARAFYVEADNKYASNQRVCLLRTKDKNRILPKFLYYSVDRNKQLLKYDSGFDQTHLKKDWIVNINIHVPPMKDQIRIVSILDSFEELINGMTHGIPAEQNARRKQYEYYRTKLLTFQELSA